MSTQRAFPRFLDALPAVRALLQGRLVPLMLVVAGLLSGGCATQTAASGVGRLNSPIPAGKGRLCLIRPNVYSGSMLGLEVRVHDQLAARLANDSFVILDVPAGKVALRTGSRTGNPIGEILLDAVTVQPGRTHYLFLETQVRRFRSMSGVYGVGVYPVETDLASGGRWVEVDASKAPMLIAGKRTTKAVEGTTF